jgi:hypothetical protein
MTGRFLATASAAAIAAVATCVSSMGEEAIQPPPFQPYVDTKTFMEHVLTPAAKIVWSVNAIVIDARGEHDLSPKSDADWEAVVSGAATLAEAASALMIPQRALNSQWNAYAKGLGDAAGTAYAAAETHDLKTISKISDRLDGICAACHRHYGVE